MAVNFESRTNIDSVLTYMFLKKIMTPIVKTPAYKLGLVNNVGKVIKKPVTDAEKSTLTILDKFIFKLRRLLGTKLTQLNNFLFLQTLSNDFYNKLIVKGSIEQRAEIKRITRDIDKIAEKYDCDVTDLVYLIANEETRNNGVK